MVNRLSNNCKKIVATNITVPSTMSVKVGATSKLAVTKTPTNSEVNLTFTSATPANATVDTNGNVKGVKAGTSVITVKDNVSGKSAKSTVTVTA